MSVTCSSPNAPCAGTKGNDTKQRAHFDSASLAHCLTFGSPGVKDQEGVAHQSLRKTALRRYTKKGWVPRAHKRVDGRACSYTWWSTGSDFPQAIGDKHTVRYIRLRARSSGLALARHYLMSVVGEAFPGDYGQSPAFGVVVPTLLRTLSDQFAVATCKDLATSISR